MNNVFCRCCDSFLWDLKALSSKQPSEQGLMNDGLKGIVSNGNFSRFHSQTATLALVRRLTLITMLCYAAACWVRKHELSTLASPSDTWRMAVSAHCEDSLHHGPFLFSIQKTFAMLHCGCIWTPEHHSLSCDACRALNAQHILMKWPKYQERRWVVCFFRSWTCECSSHSQVKTHRPCGSLLADAASTRRAHQTQPWSSD